MWLVMRGALSAQVRWLHRSYYLPSMTGIATAIYENHAGEPSPIELAAPRASTPTQQLRRHRAARGHLSVHDRAQRRAPTASTSSCTTWSSPSVRAAFLADPEAAFERAGLSDGERDLVRRRDWRGLIHYGVIFFMLEKLGAVVGVSNLHIYAAMRGAVARGLPEDAQRARRPVLGRRQGRRNLALGPKPPPEARRHRG